MDAECFTNAKYGLFIVSKNILNGVPIKYTYREKLTKHNLNGWMLYSEIDDDTYAKHPEYFVTLEAESIFSLIPIMLEIFDAPYGTDLRWIYKKGALVGFYDLNTDCEIFFETVDWKKQIYRSKLERINPILYIKRLFKDIIYKKRSKVECLDVESINNDAYGGLVVSKSILNGIPIKYTYREKSSIKQFNGWTLYSEADDDEYVNNAENFVVLSAQSIFLIAPIMIEIYDAPYGTNLIWTYREGLLVGFYNLNDDNEIIMEETVDWKTLIFKEIIIKDK